LKCKKGVWKKKEDAQEHIESAWKTACKRSIRVSLNGKLGEGFANVEKEYANKFKKDMVAMSGRGASRIREIKQRHRPQGGWLSSVGWE